MNNTICAGRHNTVGKLAKVVGVMAFAGFTAGLLGIGGALIFNPVLLQLGVHPQVGFTGAARGGQGLGDALHSQPSLPAMRLLG